MNFKAVVKGLNSFISLINVFVIKEKNAFLHLKVQKENLIAELSL